MTFFLAELRLRVPEVAATAEWYREKLQLTVESREGIDAVVRFGCNGSAALRFLPEIPERSAEQAEQHRAMEQHQEGKKKVMPTFVWIGLGGFADVDASASSLGEVGVRARIQGQFEDVGYVAHMQDCNGTTLELLQTSFAEDFVPHPLPANVLKADALLGQVKFNVADAESNLRFYRDILGMKLLSRQPVRFGFTLYFLAYTEEAQPCEDISAVENRKWLWRQRYTQVELQHFHDGRAIPVPLDGACGYDSIVFTAHTETDIDALRDRAESAGVSTEVDDDGKSIKLQDPDGRTVRFALS